jgi:hypothetical protein
LPKLYFRKSISYGTTTFAAFKHAPIKDKLISRQDKIVLGVLTPTAERRLNCSQLRATKEYIYIESAILEMAPIFAIFVIFALRCIFV